MAIMQIMILWIVSIVMCYVFRRVALYFISCNEARKKVKSRVNWAYFWVTVAILLILGINTMYTYAAAGVAALIVITLVYKIISSKDK